MKTIGIIGGMGPLATVDLFKKIVKNTDAQSDQAHARILIDNNPAIPDRSRAILGDGDDPRPVLIASARLLESMGADVLLMACNTAHYYYDDIAASVQVPLLHMLRIARDAAERKGYVCAGLLATSGTLRSGIYAEAFAGSTCSLLLPSGDEEDAIMRAIYEGVKAGKEGAPWLSPVLRSMAARGAEAFILGCTELPLAYKGAYPTIDPTLELAREALRYAGYPLRDLEFRGSGCAVREV